MNSKWYISTLMFVFCVLGISRHQNTVVPNQEIVLQFSHDAVDATVSQHAIAAVKKQLQIIGVFEIKVFEPENGLLKISYYSDLDVSIIKYLLSEKQQATIGCAFPSEKTSQGSRFPSEENDSAYYELQVFELHQADELDASLNGKLALEARADKDRFFNSNGFGLLPSRLQELQIPLNKQRLQITLVNAIAFDDLFRKIPEIRAGPSVS